MPFAKKKIDKTRESIAVSDGLWAYFCDREIPADDEDTWAQVYLDDIRELWDACKGELLARWRTTYAGTRPRHWWKWEAPRQPDSELPEPRRFLSGAGCSAHLVLAYMEEYSFGLPLSWVGVDSADLPTFESQAAYLRRHGLLSAAEASRSDFEPEAIEYHDAWFCGELSEDACIRQRIIVARRKHGMVTQ